LRFPADVSNLLDSLIIFWVATSSIILNYAHKGAPLSWGRYQTADMLAWSTQEREGG